MSTQLVGVFFVLCAIVLPYAAQLIWAVIWLAPLDPRTRHRLRAVGLVFQAWNILDVFFLALSTLDHDLGPVTAFYADTACQPLVDVIPKFVGELLHPVSGMIRAATNSIVHC